MSDGCEGIADEGIARLPYRTACSIVPAPGKMSPVRCQIQANVLKTRPLERYFERIHISWFRVQMFIWTLPSRGHDFRSRLRSFCPVYVHVSQSG